MIRSGSLQKQFTRWALALGLAAQAIPGALAISETDYAAVYARDVAPFLASGERMDFIAGDGMKLSAVRFVRADAKGTVLVVPGRTEPWLKYGEVFYDLFNRGYSVYSYDHRGQGLSPHLATKNPQIGHIDDFEKYVDDLELFVKSMIVPNVGAGSKLYLLAHSMGGGIALEYLERGANPFAAAALSSPMIDINTKPYPESVAVAISAAGVALGKAEEYAIGQKDDDPNATFETSDVTKSRARWEMYREIRRENPYVVMGGTSYGWVDQALRATRRMVRNAKKLTTPTLLLQSGHDQIVQLPGQIRACDRSVSCVRYLLPESEHEILMERDFIRDRAFGLIEDLFNRN
jgi:lysophospholipase